MSSLPCYVIISVIIIYRAEKSRNFQYVKDNNKCQCSHSRWTYTCNILTCFGYQNTYRVIK